MMQSSERHTFSSKYKLKQYEDVTFFWKRNTIKQHIYEKAHSVRDASSLREAGGGISTTRHVT